jgi:hypothetical protein
VPTAIPERDNHSSTNYIESTGKDEFVALIGDRCVPRPEIFQSEVASVSIVRVGLAETKHFADGYEAIFGKKREGTAKKKKAKAVKKKPKLRKK